MMKVEKLKENHKSYTVTISDDDLHTNDYVVSEDLVVNHRLIKGKILDETAFRLFMADYKIDASMQKAMNLLHRYPKTIEETRKYLETFVDSFESIEVIIHKLIALRFLDDFQYVKSYFDRSFHDQCNGPIKIAFELRQKGIDEAIIMGFINRITVHETERNLGMLFDHKINALGQKPKAKALISMKQYLYQKGYDPDQIEAFVSKRSALFVNLEQESKLLEKAYQTLLKKYAKTDLSEYDRHSKIIQSLMTKGYRYDAIKRIIEGSNNHD